MIVSPIADPSSVALATMAEHLTEKKNLTIIISRVKKNKATPLGIIQEKS